MIGQNLKNLFLTNPGERMMDPTFGVGLKKSLFEQNIENSYIQIKSTAQQQVKKYMPFITLNNIDFRQDTENGNVLYIKIYYIISPLNQRDSLDLEVRL